MLSFSTVRVNTVSLYYVTVRDRLSGPIFSIFTIIRIRVSCVPLPVKLIIKKWASLFVLPVCLSSQEVESTAALSSRMKGAGGVGGGWQQQGRSTGPPPPPGGKSKVHSFSFQ